MANQSRFIANNGLDNNSKTIVNVADPVNAQDAATKNFASNASNITSGTLNTTLVPDFNALLTKVSSTPAISPALNLDFINAKTLDSRITFTRNSNATLVGKTGLIEYAPHNLLTYSEQFDNAVWVKGNATITANAATAPDGTTTADKLVENTAAAVTHQLTLGGVAGLDRARERSISIYVKADGRSILRIQDNAFSSNFTRGFFNLATQTAYTAQNGGGVASNAVITDVGNGWFRCSYRSTPNTTTGGGSDITYAMCNTGENTDYTGDGTSGIYIWGAQLNVGALQDYYPTTSSAYYGPRFDYDPVTLACKGLLIEEQRTNLLTYSEQFDNAVWAKTVLTVTANVTTAPDDTTNADSVTTSGATPSVAYAVQTTSATTGVYSIYAKANTARYLVLARGLYASGDYAIFDLQTGTITKNPTYAGSVASILPGNNGWFRCVLNSAQSTITNAVSVSGSGTDITTGTSGAIYIWGAQLEAGSSPTSYIPTTSAQATRTVDVAVMTGTDFSSWYNQSEGTFYVETDFSLRANTGSNRRFTANDGTATNFISIASTLIATATRFLMTTGGVTQVGSNASTVNPALNKDAMSYATNNVLCCTNAGTVVADTAATIPTVNQLVIGLDLTTGSSFALNGHLRRIAYFSRSLPNDALIGLTL